jgi:transcriptional regulator with XRE-family HTH domain
MTPEQAFERALRALREERGLTREPPALRSGYHATYSSQLEHGMQRPWLGTRYRLARNLLFAPAEFLLHSDAGVDEPPIRHP